MISHLGQAPTGEHPQHDHLDEAQLLVLHDCLVRLLAAEAGRRGCAHAHARPGFGRDHLDLARAVRDALGRLEQQQYGRCERCLGPIPYGRLEVVPYAQRCTGCAHEVI